MKLLFKPIMMLFLISTTRQFEFWQTTDKSSAVTVNDVSFFQHAVNKHTRICQGDLTCLTKPSSCCGSCTCDEKCIEHGSCCLKIYQNFHHAGESVKKSRYGCVRNQYLAPENSDYNTLSPFGFWMITKCDPTYKEQAEINMCHNPSDELGSVVPVTEPGLLSRHFRNKHCAYCNNVDKNSPLIYWKFNLKGTRFITFPAKRILQELVDTRGNIEFLPDKYIDIGLYCKPPPDNLIETCNVTRQWQNFNANIKTACESFTDPFNGSYKNIFCFVCNHGNTQLSSLSNDTKCPEGPSDSLIPFRPIFSITTDHIMVENGHNAAHLICKDDEFQDLYSKVCRKVFCYDQFSLDNGECKKTTEKVNTTCSRLFIKLTPSAGDATLTRKDIDELSFTMEIHSQTFESVSESRVELGEEDSEMVKTDIETMVFFKTNETDSLEYAVVYMVKAFVSKWGKRNFLKNVDKNHAVYIHYRSNTELEMKFEAELASYNITMTTDGAEIEVPYLSDESIGMKVHKLESYTRYKENHDVNCSLDETEFISKLHMCPYIKVLLDELEFNIQNGYLFVRGNYLPEKETVKPLSPWEFEVYDGHIFICLHDYFEIYKRIARLGNFGTKTNAAQTKCSLNVAWICIILLEVKL